MEDDDNATPTDNVPWGTDQIMDDDDNATPTDNVPLGTDQTMNDQNAIHMNNLSWGTGLIVDDINAMPTSIVPWGTGPCANPVIPKSRVPWGTDPIINSGDDDLSSKLAKTTLSNFPLLDLCGKTKVILPLAVWSKIWMLVGPAEVVVRCTTLGVSYAKPMDFLSVRLINKGIKEFLPRLKDVLPSSIDRHMPALPNPEIDILFFRDCYSTRDQPKSEMQVWRESVRNIAVWDELSTWAVVPSFKRFWKVKRLLLNDKHREDKNILRELDTLRSLWRGEHRRNLGINDAPIAEITWLSEEELKNLWGVGKINHRTYLGLSDL